MVAEPQDLSPGSLLVFSDDWGRHPSSCQHLVRQLLPRYPVVWVNTIGTRAPRLDLATARRAAGKLREWFRPQRSVPGEPEAPEQGPRVVSPRMWPWFTRPIDRRINLWSLRRQLTDVVGSMPPPVTAISTLPITADLVGQLPVARWVYYCVDDFSEWPGLDGVTLKAMDQQMLRAADTVVCVSETLREAARQAGRESTLLTHGVDLDFWRGGAADSGVGDLASPVVLFWGVVDRRMHTETIAALSEHMGGGSLVFVGPHQDPDPRLLALPRCHFPGPVAFERLPALAQAADVLIMPYADLPVTRAMQPLKLKEYLATGLPTVTTPLPAVESLRDMLDVGSSPQQFAELVLTRIRSGTPANQRAARARLADESWAAKARQLEHRISPEAARQPGQEAIA